MSTNFPTSLDTLTNPTSTNTVAAVDHAAQHANANDAITALETKVGADSSAVTTTLDYKLKNSSSTDPGHKHTEGAITLADVTTDDVTSTKHGFAPKAPADATKFLNGAATPAYAQVKDSDLTFTDITTNNASTTKHGFLLKLDNVTTHFLRGDGTWATASTAISATTILPPPNFVYDNVGNTAFNSNTTAYVEQVKIPYSITVNQVSIDISAHTTNGTLKLALFSEDGQTQIFSVTTATITATGIVSTAVSAVTVAAGNYYFVVVPVSTVNTAPLIYVNLSSTLHNTVTSKARLFGTVTVTASTMPSTITPTSITATDNVGTVFRLDN